MILILPLLFIVGMGPSLLVLALAAYFSPEKYNLKPYRMLFLTIIVSICIAAIINLELEAGLLSGLIYVCASSFVLSIVLVPLIILYKYYEFAKVKNA